MKKKLVWIIGGIVLLLAIGASAYFIFFNKEKEPVLTEAEKFAGEYTSVTKDNVFVYRDINDIIKILKEGTGIVYLGFPECPWCNAYVKYLNDYAKEEGITKIYYYNILNDRKNDTKEYKEIVSILKKYLEKDDEGNERIYVPNVTFVINGKIIANDLETAKDTHNKKTPEEYWTESEVKDLKKKLTTNMKKVLETNTCTDCNKD